MQSHSSIHGKQPAQKNAKLPAPEPPSPKEITLRTLGELKQKLYKDAARSIKYNPDKADIIQKAVDRDGARIAYAINTIALKM
jgi:hypothetical protein